MCLCVCVCIRDRDKDRERENVCLQKDFGLKGFLSLFMELIGSESLKEMGMPDHLTCLLRNLYAGEEATVRNLLCGTTNWFRIEKGV